MEEGIEIANNYVREKIPTESIEIVNNLAKKGKELASNAGKYLKIFPPQPQEVPEGGKQPEPMPAPQENK